MLIVIFFFFSLLTLGMPSRGNSCPTIRPTLSPATSFTGAHSCRSEVAELVSAYMRSVVTDLLSHPQRARRPNELQKRANSDFYFLTFVLAVLSDHCILNPRRYRSWLENATSQPYLGAFLPFQRPFPIPARPNPNPNYRYPNNFVRFTSGSPELPGKL